MEVIAMRLTFPCFVVLATSMAVTVAHADDLPKAPEAPKGWEYITADDGSYRFLLPTEKKRSGTREQSSKRGGLSVKAKVNYCELADGLALVVSVEKLSGPALKGMKI